VTAVKPLLSSSWLTVDTDANVGSGTGPHVQDAEAAELAARPVEGAQLAAPESDASLWDGASWDGGWGGGWSQGGWRQGPITVNESSAPAQPTEVQGPLGKTVAARLTVGTHPGYVEQSQVTDTKGWKQNIPSGRSATSTLLGAEGVGVENYWPKLGMARPRRLLAQPTGDGQFANVPAGGNTVYDTPPPPSTSTATAPAGTGSSDWQWGF
jgi:hypothetical protein